MKQQNQHFSAIGHAAPVSRFRHRLSTSLSAFILLMWAMTASAINYSNLNLVAAFSSESGSREMVVDLGPASRYYNAAPGSSFPITNYSVASQAFAFSSFNNHKWSVFGSVTGTNGTPAKPKSTTWATRPRTSLNVRSTPWVRRQSLSMTSPAVKVDDVGNKAIFYANSVLADPIANNNTTVVIPAGDRFAPSDVASLTVAGNFGGSWEGIVINVTPSDFVETKGLTRSDLFEVVPSSTNGASTFLGYFQFKWDGTMTFTAATPAPGMSQASPVTGSVAGGTLVTLTGSNFVAGATVSFGSVTSSVVSVVNGTMITATTPAGAAGTVDVVVINPDGQFATLTNGFTYQAGAIQPPPPAILGIAANGASLVMRSAGATNGSLRVLTSTNVAALLIDWTPVATNNVGANGLSTNVIPIAPGSGQRFFRLAIP